MIQDERAVVKFAMSVKVVLYTCWGLAHLESETLVPVIKKVGTDKSDIVGEICEVLVDVISVYRN